MGQDRDEALKMLAELRSKVEALTLPVLPAPPAEGSPVITITTPEGLEVAIVRQSSNDKTIVVMAHANHTVILNPRETA